MKEARLLCSVLVKKRHRDEVSSDAVMYVKDTRYPPIYWFRVGAKGTQKKKEHQLDTPDLPWLG